MAIYNSESNEALSLEGVHLYHFPMSSCSQRVRFGLAEKGVTWESHILDMRADEHLTPRYKAINPNAVVPTLVYDGQVVLESNDILFYLDEIFEGPSLVSPDEADQDIGHSLIDLSSDNQNALKTMTHELLFRGSLVFTPEDLEAKAKAGAKEESLAFMTDFAENGEAWLARFKQACDEMNAALAQLEARLTESPWLTGADFGLVDISWSVNLFRLRLCKFDLGAYPKLNQWADQVHERPAFKSAVSEYKV